MSNESNNPGKHNYYADEWMSLSKEHPDRPFEDLQDNTLESLGSWERLSQSDREAVEKEKAYRAETQTQKTDETKSPVEDFKEHGFRLDKSEDGIKVAVPTEFFLQQKQEKESQGIHDAPLYEYNGQTHETIENREKRKERTSFDDLIFETYSDIRWKYDENGNLVNADYPSPKQKDLIKRFFARDIIDGRRSLSVDYLYKDAYAREVVAKGDKQKVSYDDLRQDTDEEDIYLLLNSEGRMITRAYKGYFIEAKVTEALEKKYGARFYNLSIEKDFNDLSAEKKKELEQEAIHNAIRYYYGYFAERIKKEPEQVNRILEEHEIDKFSQEVFLDAIEGLGGHKIDSQTYETYDDFFNVSKQIIENKDKLRYRRAHSVGDFGFAYEYDEDKSIYLDSKELTNRIEEWIRPQEEKIKELLIKDYQSDDEFIKKRLQKYYATDQLRSQNFESFHYNLSKFIDTIKSNDNEINFKTDIDIDKLQKCSQEAKTDIPEKLLRDRNDMVSVPIPMEKIAKFGNILLEEAIYRGLGEEYSYYEYQNYYNGSWHSNTGRRKSIIDATEFFRSDFYQNNKDLFGLDYESPKIIDLAYHGLMNVIGTQNGEQSGTARWYYDEILRNDPDFLSKIKEIREGEDQGTKAKITRYLKHNPQIFEDQRERNEISEKVRERERSIQKSVIRECSGDDLRKLLRKKEAEIYEEFSKRGAITVSTFEYSSEEGGITEEKGKTRLDTTPIDMGIEKINKLLSRADWIKANIPNSDLRYFQCAFPDQNDIRNVNFESSLAYNGIIFKYKGKQCVLSESFNPTAGAYASVGEIGSDFKEMFDVSKKEAQKMPGVVVIDHLSKEVFDQSIADTHEKAMLFFNSGNKDDILVTKHGGNSEKWREYSRGQMPAYPLSEETTSDLAESGIEQKELDRYHEWQDNQRNQQTSNPEQ